MQELENLRQEIDQADEALLQALARRMEAVDHILQRKEAAGLPLFDEKREDSLLSRIVTRAADKGLDARLAEQVLRAVIRHSREVQARRVQHDRNPELGRVARVAFQGTQGAYSWLACRKRFGEDVEPIGYGTFSAAARAVERGEVDLALLPIENVLAGSIYEVYDLLAEGRLHVVGEEVLLIEHCLIGFPGVPLEQLRAVLSHPVALRQCTTFLEGLPNARVESYIDSAEAVRKVKDSGDPSLGAIASQEAARLYGLEVLRDGISDHPENYTRFWVIARKPVTVDPRIPSKTSLILVTEHREGALVSCLSALAAQGVNMTKLESRPRRGMPWQYQFHIDVEGNLAEERVVRALDDLRSRARFLRVLGCYPRADHERRRPVPLPPLEVDGLENGADAQPLVSLSRRKERSVVWVGDEAVGQGSLTVAAALMTTLHDEPLARALSALRQNGARILQYPSFCPRLINGELGEGRELVEAARQQGLAVSYPVSSSEEARLAAGRVDLLEIHGAHMQNFNLLAEVGKLGKPVLLYRSMSSTVQELLAAAEVVLEEGNQQVILCEQGIRTFESGTRSTLDLGAVLLIKEQSHLPVLVDPMRAAHSSSRVAPLARAARAVGVDGLILNVALNGSEEPALTLPQFRELAELLAND